jgi:hypothetical protein
MRSCSSRIRIVAAALAALAAGCGGGEEPPAAGDAEVTVSFVQLHITDQGDVEHVPDLSNRSVAALVPEAAGGFREIPAAPSTSAA